MANYVATVSSPWTAEKAFDHIADFRTVQEWDPGVSSSTLVEGDEPGVGAVYRVAVATGPLRYRTLEFDRPGHTVLEARAGWLRSYDVIEVSPTEDGCRVTYDATLELRGPLALADPLLAIAFRRIGDKAAAGLAAALDGAIV